MMFFFFDLSCSVFFCVDLVVRWCFDFWFGGYRVSHVSAWFGSEFLAGTYLHQQVTFSGFVSKLPGPLAGRDLLRLV